MILMGSFVLHKVQIFVPCELVLFFGGLSLFVTYIVCHFRYMSLITSCNKKSPLGNLYLLIRIHHTENFKCTVFMMVSYVK